VLVSGGAAAEEVECFFAGVPEFVLLAGGDRDGVAGFYFAGFVFDADTAGAVGDVINFFGFGMVMFLRAGADGQAGLGEALVADSRVAMREEFADFGAVFGDEGG